MAWLKRFEWVFLCLDEKHIKYDLAGIGILHKWTFVQRNSRREIIFLAFVTFYKGSKTQMNHACHAPFVVTVWTTDGITTGQLEQMNVHNCMKSHAKAE